MIVATAGHVDHGKTLLVKALTGMDTDRMEEEKRRGLSINLGFAFRQGEQGQSIAFVDVPGHTRFINNMIAGINGIDLGMLVVAADDGPMPQTREHLGILRLLGVQGFVVVISKIDRVDDDHLELVHEEVRALFPDEKDLAICEVDTPAGRGITELVTVLESHARSLPGKNTAGYFRLSIDRAFNVRGSGLVVTGTVASGTVRTEDRLLLQPQGKEVRVRSLQAQERQVEAASSGQRCALNITGEVHRQDIDRGDWLLALEGPSLSERFDARLSLLEQAPFKLKHMSPVKLYIGAKRIGARLALLEGRSLAPGQDMLVQLLPEKPVHACIGDRFLIRDDSENETLGGGVVIDPRAPRTRRNSPLRLAILTQTENATPRDTLRHLLFDLKQAVQLEPFCKDWNIRTEDMEVVLSLAGLEETVDSWEQEGTTWLIEQQHWQAINGWLQEQMSGDTTGKGLARHQLRTQLDRQFPGIPLDYLLDRAQASGDVIVKGRLVRPRQTDTGLSAKDAALWEVIEQHLETCGAKVPVLTDLATATGTKESQLSTLITTASRQHWLYMVAPNRPVLATQLRHFAESALQLTADDKAIAVTDFRKTCDCGRNLAVEVLEYFDKIGFTLRKDSGRVILDRERVNKLLNT